MFDKIIFEKIMKCSENRPQPKGLTNETIKKVSDYFKENFDSCLPQGYIEFLNVMNGFSYDGHSIFCCYNDDIGVRIDIWTHLMRECIINYVH